jgi:hypothetical protein
VSMAYIREHYKVPAKRGGRIIYTGGRFPMTGTIVGSRNAHLRVRMDGFKRIEELHPTWNVEYVQAVAA